MPATLLHKKEVSFQPYISIFFLHLQQQMKNICQLDS